MPRPRANAKKDIVLFVSGAPLGTLDLLHAYGRSLNEKFRTAVIYDPKQPHSNPYPQEKLDSFDIKLPVNLNSLTSIQTALVPYVDSFLAVTCRGESDIPNFRKVVPHVPYVR